MVAQWRWTNQYRRIGVHRYRRRSLYRNYQGHWRRVRSYWHLWRRNHYYKARRWFWGRYRRVGRHLYRLRILKRWTGAKWVVVRKYWHLYRKNHYNHRLHGKTKWTWGGYRRIGVHLYRHRTLYRNVQGHWRRVRAYWHKWRHNHYYKRPRWFWTNHYKRIGRHRYRRQIYRRWTGGKWITVRRYWRLFRKNHYNHRHHGRRKWVWGRFKRIGLHRYRLRTLFRNVQGRWRRVRSYWHLYRRNHYYKKSRWHWGGFKRVGYHMYRRKILKR